jgi:integrase
MSEEPVYIPETHEFLLLRQFIRPDLLAKNVHKGHVDMAFDVLARILVAMYQATSIAKLVDRSVMMGEALVFSTHMSNVIHQMKWARDTTYNMLSVLRKILSETAMSVEFIKTIKVIRPQHVVDPYLGKKYSTLLAADPIRIRLDNWVQQIRQHTRNRSALSIRNILAFIINKLLPALGISLTIWPNDVAHIVTTKLSNQEIVQGICGAGSQIKRHGQWIQIFCDYLVPCEFKLVKFDVHHSTKEPFFDDGSDHHRIDAHDLERIQVEVVKNIKHELIFMLLLTVGMRVGGLVNIKIEHVAVVMSKDIQIKDSGRTLEKGSKWFTFMMCPRVQELMYLWITQHRPADPSPYLFPGQCASSGHMTTANVRYLFKKWCKMANLKGSQFHPHALRHSFAHMLLESGNDVSTVSKLLNHSNTQITEQFYLRENISQVTSRANIVWMTKTNKHKMPIVPAFLDSNRTSTSTTTDRTKKRRKMMTTLNMF